MTDDSKTSEIFFPDENCISNKLHKYIQLNTKGDKFPTEIWLNKDDYMQLYKELQAIQRMYRGHGVLEVPEKKVKAGFRAVYFDGIEVVYNALAEPLPAEINDMITWKNIPYSEVVK